MAGTLFVVATPIGNLEDITLRALRVLREVQLIAAEDTRRTARLLARHEIRTPTTSLHEHNETAKLPRILERLERGEQVALVSDAGTPTIADPGRRLVQSALAAGIRVEPVPGPSAILAAVMACGLDVTWFTFLGFPPVRSRDRNVWFSRLTTAEGPVVFFEAPHRIRRTLEEIRTKLGDVPATLGRELTKVHEEFVKGPISSILEHLTVPKGELTVVLDLGHTTYISSRAIPPNELCLGLTTEHTPASRRDDIRLFATRYGLTPNQLYELIETSRKDVK
jgi:16S rRNA (cytidine1402-2'-O)-methyltransferase